MFTSMPRIPRIIVASLFVLVSAAFGAAHAADLKGTASDATAAPVVSGGSVASVVDTCEVPADFYDGNCPPTVIAYFDGWKPTSQQVADVAVALGERLQRAEAENDIGLCIDLAEGILRVALYAADAEQRNQIIELARSACCLRLTGTNHGIQLGGAPRVPVTGPEDDGVLTSGAKTFTSATASFVTDGVKAGDVLLILSGGQIGFYQISGVVDANTLAVNFGGWTASEGPVKFEIRRPEHQDEYCEPGTTSAISVPVPSNPATAS